ncbi:MAG: hypothetical protein FWF18_03710 [Dehalococcoidia bacterium]|nr:hypothetical protein [Dehalococcoidia bacterium]
MQKALIAGILSIVSGVFSLLSTLILLVMPAFTEAIINDAASTASEPVPEGLLSFLTAIYIVIAIFYFILGVLSIVGGIFACQRKRWGWALAGAIAAILSFTPIGIAAVILLSIGKQEFDQPATQLK